MRKTGPTRATAAVQVGKTLLVIVNPAFGLIMPGLAEAWIAGILTKLAALLVTSMAILIRSAAVPRSRGTILDKTVMIFAGIGTVLAKPAAVLVGLGAILVKADANFRTYAAQVLWFEVIAWVTLLKG